MCGMTMGLPHVKTECKFDLVVTFSLNISIRPSVKLPTLREISSINREDVVDDSDEDGWESSF